MENRNLAKLDELGEKIPVRKIRNIFPSLRIDKYFVSSTKTTPSDRFCKNGNEKHLMTPLGLVLNMYLQLLHGPL